MQIAVTAVLTIFPGGLGLAAAGGILAAAGEAAIVTGLAGGGCLGNILKAAAMAGGWR